MKDWLKLQNEKGRYVAVGSVLRYFLSLYRFHPRERFLNGLRVSFQTTTGVWKRFAFERSMLQRIFHVCMEDASDRKTVVKLPRGDNAYSCNFIKTLRPGDVFEHYKRALAGIRKDRWMQEHSVEVFNIYRDGGYASEYVDGFNLAHLRDELFDAEVLPKHLRTALVKAINQLIMNLRGYHTQHGELVGDWGLHNLVFSPEKGTIINVDAEGFFTFKQARWENNLPWIEGYLNDIAEFLQLLDSVDLEDGKIVAIFKILDQVRRSGKEYSGVDFLVGYHSLELNGKMFRGQRECLARIARIPFDFKDKVVVDLGCNSGGMLHALSPKIERGYGFDFNPKCVNAAHAIKSLSQSGNLEFFNFDLDRDDLSLLPCLLLHGRVDICFLLSVCMWLQRWRLVVQQAARMADALLFESNGTAEQQEDQLAQLRVFFGEVQLLSDNSPDDPLQGARKLYLCTANKLRSGDSLKSPANTSGHADRAELAV